MRIGRLQGTSPNPALSAPGARNGKGVVQGLDIHEQDAAIGGEDGTRELVLVLRVGVAGESEDLALGGDAAEVRELLLLEGIDEVLTDDEVSIGSHTEVVAAGQEVALSWFEKEFHHGLGALVVVGKNTKDLSPLLRSAIGAAKVDRPFVVKDALSPGEAGGALPEPS